MRQRINKIISIIITFIIVFSPFTAYAQVNTAAVQRFSDIPEGHWADEIIHEARAKNITQGMENNRFGLGIPLKRSEFVKSLVSILNWELIDPAAGSFNDNRDRNQWFYKYVETAAAHAVFGKDSGVFRPDEPITREEMAVMIVRGLGYDLLAEQKWNMERSFADVDSNVGYITVAKDLGIVSGKGNNLFEPSGTASREEGIAMLMRMYNKLNSGLQDLHAFYAISSYGQRDFIPSLSSVSFGWSRLEFDPVKNQVILNMSQQNGNSFSLPARFSEPVALARENHVSAQLSVFASQEQLVTDTRKQSQVGLVEYIVSDPEVRKSVIASIMQQLDSTEKDGEKTSFDGVVIDFENMKDTFTKGSYLSQSFNIFLSELKEELVHGNKKLYVAVHPKRKPGQPYYDGYDYKAIGKLADKVILMAHDYNATRLTEEEMKQGYTLTPLTPIDEIYYALKAATDKNSGISDPGKIWLQVSFGSVQWKLKDGKVINQSAYLPYYSSIRERLVNTDPTQNLSIQYPENIKNPLLRYFNSGDTTDNVLWYEDSRSVQAKIQMAKMFGVTGISLWRLGTVPNYEAGIHLDVWQQIVKLAGK